MNIIDIVKNAPEGAERYRVFGEGSCIEYYAIINGVKSFYSLSKKRWRECGAGNFDSSLPLPKLKTEYQKVEDKHSITIEQFEYEGVNFYLRRQDCGQYVELNRFTLYEKLRDNKPIYRKIEKVADEKQEFEIKLNEIAKEHFNSGTEEAWTDYLYKKGCRFIESD